VARWRAAVAGMVVASAVLLGCTSGEQQEVAPPPVPAPPAETSPPSGIRIGFVLPPAASDEDEQRLQVAGDLQTIGALRDEGVSDLRTLEPDGPAFVADLATWLAERRTDLICVLGPDAQRTVTPLAERHPHLEFCALPSGATDPPENVTAVELRFEELGHLVGVTALAAAGDGPIAAVVGSDRAGVARFRDGMRAGAAGEQLLESAPTDEQEVLAAVDDAVSLGARALVLDVGAGAREAVSRAAAAGVLVLAPSAVLASVEDPDVARATVLGWRLRWDVALRPVVGAMLDPEEEAPTSVGFADGLFLVSPGPSLDPAVEAEVEETVSGLRRQARDPLAPPPGVDEDVAEAEILDGEAVDDAGAEAGDQAQD
jgi:hypothetical protein